MKLKQNANPRVSNFAKERASDRQAAKRQWQRLSETGLRPAIILQDEQAALDKAAFNVMGLDAKERELLDNVYGEVFNAAGAIRITDEDHLLRAYESGNPHAYIEGNLGMLAQDKVSSGLNRHNADDLHHCISKKTMPVKASNTPDDVRHALEVYTYSDAVWPLENKPLKQPEIECGLR